jgi:antitoxin ParD1/3/4
VFEVSRCMTTSMNVFLPDALKEYVEDQVKSGSYGTSSEYLQALILSDKNRRSRERLEDLLLEGLESEEPVPVTPEFWRELWDRVDARKKSNTTGTSSE